MNNTHECQCCIGTFDNSKYKCVECPHCKYAACKQCVRNYLLSTTSIPNCMNCHKPFDQEFLVLSLNRTWVMKDYKEHRKKLLFEREYAKLADTMPKIAAHKKITELTKQKAELSAKMVELRRLLTIHTREQYNINVKINLIKNGEDPDGKKKKFIMACPSEGCRGFLSSSYKCELCSLYTCPRCREIVGYNKDNPEHVCDEDNVKSTELIKKETKGCPTCGARIFKIDGCDQMWCTECKVAFSWKTGKIDKGVVHNPHFYHWHRQNGTLARNPGDNPCGGLVPWWQLRNTLIRRLNNRGINDSALQLVTWKPNRSPNSFASIMENIGSFHRTISHIQNVTLVDCRRRINENQDHENVRLSYLLDEIDKKDMAMRIYRKEAVARKEIELSHIYELLVTCSIDFFRMLQEEMINDIDTFTGTMSNYTDALESINAILIRRLDEMRKLIDYCNNRFGIISGVYSFKAPYIDEVFALTKKKKLDVKGLQNMVITESDAPQNPYPNGEGGK